MTCDRYHPPLKALILFDNQYISLETNIYYNFHKADYGALNNYLLQINWIELYCLEDVNDILDAFYSIIWNAIELFVPKISVKRSNFPVWFSSELKSKVIAKKIAHKKYKTTNKYHHYIEFKNLRDECSSLTEQSYNTYVSEMEVRINENAGEFWKFIKNKTNGHGALPGSMFLGEESENDKQKITELFAKHFGTVYSTFNCKSLDNLESNEIFSQQLEVEISNL